VQIDRFAGLLDGVLDRAAGRSTADNVGDGHAEQVMIVGLLDFDREPQAEWTGPGIKL
jgi:hypothetical protein